MSTADVSLYHDFSAIARLRADARAGESAAVSETARQFESIFLGYMIQAMRQAMPGDTLFGGNRMQAYQDMFDRQLGLSLADRGGVGLAAIIERQIAAGNEFSVEDQHPRQPGQ